VNIRFLRRAGVPGPAAVTAVGLKSFLSFLTQSSLLVVLLVLAGSTGVGAAPRVPGTVLIAAAAVVLTGGLGAAVPAGRRLVRRRLWPALRQAMASLRQLTERPALALLAVAGSFLVLACQVLALGASTQAFHAHLPVVTLGLVVLGASAAAAAVPSPGGLGPAEAAYTAGLVIAGLDGSTAIASVLLFRLATYWVPLVPGGISFWVLRSRRRI
jgi:glycosyltransferase 2 family protein